MDTFDPTTIIERLGGPAKVAAIFNITPEAVTQWKTNGIPETRLMFLRIHRKYKKAFDNSKWPAPVTTDATASP